MSLFLNPSANLIESIKWFNSLTPEQQESFRSIHMDGLGSANLANINFFITLLGEIQKALISKTKDEIIEKFKELGIDHTNASLLINKVISEKPPYQLDSKNIASATDPLFQQCVKSVFEDIYINNSPDTEFANKFGTDIQVFRAVHRVIRDIVLFKHLRGEFSIDAITNILKNAYAISQDRITFILDQLKKHSDFIRDKYLFSNTQDSYFYLQRIAQSQEQLVAEIRDLTAFLKQIYKQYGQNQQPSSAIQ